MNLDETLKEHSRIIDTINEINLDACDPHTIAKVQYFYSQARALAYRIAGHYKAEYKHYEAQAEIQQGLGYKAIRRKEDERYKDLTTAADAQYLSRITKGKMLDQAAEPEGLYATWKGIADTYESSINALKDMIRTLENERNG